MAVCAPSDSQVAGSGVFCCLIPWGQRARTVASARGQDMGLRQASSLPAPWGRRGWKPHCFPCRGDGSMGSVTQMSAVPQPGPQKDWLQVAVALDG